VFQELFSALLARESPILRRGNRGRQNKTKPNQTKLLQTAASSPPPAGTLAGWLGWLLLLIQLLMMALQKNRMAAGQSSGQKRSISSSRATGTAATATGATVTAAADLIELRPTSSIIHSDFIGHHPSHLVRIISHHPSFIARSTDIIHHSF
jgi:hypothetical protein